MVREDSASTWGMEVTEEITKSFKWSLSGTNRKKKKPTERT